MKLFSFCFWLACCIQMKVSTSEVWSLSADFEVHLNPDSTWMQLDMAWWRLCKEVDFRGATNLKKQPVCSWRIQVSLRYKCRGAIEPEMNFLGFWNFKSFVSKGDWKRMSKCEWLNLEDGWLQLLRALSRPRPSDRAGSRCWALQSQRPIPLISAAHERDVIKPHGAWDIRIAPSSSVQRSCRYAGIHSRQELP